jgi:hypothetical protein
VDLVIGFVTNSTEILKSLSGDINYEIKASASSSAPVQFKGEKTTWLQVI